jgi:peptidoglycan/xylan/chitin deacetylase (PgdA/CDA1 family)
MRIRPALAASALIALALAAAGCNLLAGADGAPAAARRAAPGTRVTGRSSTVWKFAPSLVGKEWESIPTSTRVVALTFDAGSGDQGVASILSTLEEKNVTATFFLTGKWVQMFPDEAQSIASRYPVGNHTLSHPEHLLDLSGAQVVAEVKGGAEVIRSVTQADSRPLFRFPYGSSDARTIGIVNELGYGGIRWTVDTLGWKGADNGQSVASVQSRILGGLQPGEIVLMHVGAANDGTTLDADALPAVIDALRARGYRFTNLYRFAARYAQVADDGTRRFSAPSGWNARTLKPHFYGSGYHVASPAATGSPATFRMRSPQTASYRLFAWWPVSPSFNSNVSISLAALSGTRSVVVNQRVRGGQWVSLGRFSLRAGDGSLVRVSRTSARPGAIAADAFRLTSLAAP